MRLNRMLVGCADDVGRCGGKLGKRGWAVVVPEGARGESGASGGERLAWRPWMADVGVWSGIARRTFWAREIMAWQ